MASEARTFSIEEEKALEYEKGRQQAANVIDTASGLYEQGKEKLVESAAEAKEGYEAGKDAGEEAVEEGVKEAKSVLGQVWSTVTGLAEKTIESVSHSVSNAIDSVVHAKDITRETSLRAVESAEVAFAGAKAKTGEILESAKGAASQAVHVAGEYVETGKHAAGEYVEAGKEKIVAVAEATKEKAEAVVDAAKEKASEVLFSAEKAKARAQGATDEILERSESLTESGTIEGETESDLVGSAFDPVSRQEATFEAPADTSLDAKELIRQTRGDEVDITGHIAIAPTRKPDPESSYEGEWEVVKGKKHQSERSFHEATAAGKSAL